MNKFKHQVASGVIYASFERLSAHGIKLIISIILARLLEPEQFGIFGLLYVFLALAQVIQDSGFSSALIQKKAVTLTDKSSIFIINLIVGALVTGILFLSAGLLARFFNEPILIPLTQLMSFVILINSFGLVQRALLTKKLNFKTQLIINLGAGISSGLVGIILAYFGFGVWSLAIQSLLSSFFTVILLWIHNPWHPTMQINFSAIKDLFSFGSKLLASAIIDTVFRNIYQAFIGKTYTTRDLGFFSSSKTILDSFLNITSGSLSRVLFPAFSPLQDNPAQLKKGYQKAIRLSSFLHFPLMIGLWAIAEPMIILVLTEKWSGSIQIFKLLCIANLIHPLHVINLNILKVKGRSDLFLRLEVIKKIIVIFAILLTFRSGIHALLYGHIATVIIAYFINSIYSGKLISYGIIEQIREVFPSFVTSLAMGGSMYLIDNLVNYNNLVALTLMFITGVAVYFLLNFIINNPALKEVSEMGKSLIKQWSHNNQDA